MINRGSHSHGKERKFCSVSSRLHPTRNVLLLVFEVVRTVPGFLWKGRSSDNITTLRAEFWNQDIRNKKRFPVTGPVWPRGWVEALDGGECSSARPGHTLPSGKTRYPFYRRLGALQGWSGRAENLVPTGIRSRTFQPLVSRCTSELLGPRTFGTQVENIRHSTLYLIS